MADKDGEALESESTQPADVLAETDPASAPGLTDTLPVESATSVLAGTIRVGTRIGRFTVLEHLGEGAMGLVLGAYDADLDRKVAIKLLRPRGGSSNAESQQRLLREARAMAKLSHPNVLTVHEVGTVGATVFVAMEIASCTLKGWLAEGKRSWREILQMYIAAGRGLAAAHDAGLVHRDFKPENVMVTDRGQVRVADFGLVGASLTGATGSPSAEVDGPASLGARLTQTGAIMGTPVYMAPEQHGGEDVDARADQFSFCVALYEAVHDQRPFAGKSYSELVANVRAGAMRPPPADSGVPAWVTAVLARGLATEPGDRYSSMAELLDALAADPARKRRQRQKQVALAGAFAALAGLAAFGLTSAPDVTKCQVEDSALSGVWDDTVKQDVRAAFLATQRANAAETYERVARRLDSYAAAWSNQRVEACEATHVRGEQSAELLDLRMLCLDRRSVELAALADVFASEADADVIDNAVKAAGELPSVSDCADVAALRERVPRPADPAKRELVVALDERLARASALERAGKAAEAREVIDEVVERSADLDYPPIQARATFLTAVAEEALGDANAAESAYYQAAEHAAAARDDELVARAWIQLLYIVSLRQQRFDVADVIHRVASTAVERAGSPAGLRADLAMNLGTSSFAKGEYEEAEARYAEALAIRERDPDADPLGLAKNLNNLGAAARYQSRSEAALHMYQRAHDVFVRELGEFHPLVASALTNIGVVQLDRGDYNAARPYLEQALQIREELFGAGHPLTARAATNVGNVRRDAGDYVEAERYYKRALSVFEESRGRMHPETTVARRALAWILREQGGGEEAREQLQIALDATMKRYGEQHPETGKVLTDLALAEEWLGLFEQASERLRGARAIYEAAELPVSVAGTYQSTGSLMFTQGRYRDAVRAYSTALETYREHLDEDDHRLVSARLGLGESYARLGRVRSAIEHLTEAHQRSGRLPPSLRARVAFELAKVLWIEGTERDRAVELAVAARDFYASNPTTHPRRDEVAQWLRDHRVGS